MKTDASASLLSRDREVWTVLVSLVLANALFVFAISEGFLSMRFFHKGRFVLLGLVLASAVFLFRGWRAPFALLAPLKVWRLNPAWFLLAICWPPAMAMLALVAKGVVLGTGLAEITPTLAVVTRRDVFAMVLLGAFVGEIVWVSYAIGRLSKLLTPFVSSAIVGLFWGLWWTPLALFGIGIVPGIPVAALIFSMVGVALMCGFVYTHTRSALVVMSLQLSVNSSVLVFPIAPQSGGVPTYVAWSVIYLLCTVLLHVAFGPKPLLKPAAAAA